MNIVRYVPDLEINEEFDIKTVQKFIEDDHTVIVRCAEYIPQFIRGFVCDMKCEYCLVDEKGRDQEPFIEYLSDLVLVYIHKSCDMGSIPAFDYVFYK